MESQSLTNAADFAQLGDETKSHFILPRMGEAPVSFDGRIIGKGSSRTRKGFLDRQWHDVALYETNGGTFILYIAYRTNGYMESDVYDVFTFDTTDAARQMLLAYDPLQYSIGLPFFEDDHQSDHDRERARQKHQDKQDDLESALTDGYEAIVARLLASDERFAVRIE